MDNKKDILRKNILNSVKEYYTAAFAEDKNFEKGDRIIYGGRVFDETELEYLVDASLDFWLTSGRYAENFEKEFSTFLGIKYCALVNSGSSANLLAFMALTSPLLKDKRINKGDEVITVACGFPTTVSPIIQYGAIPVFVDVSFPSYNVSVEMLDKALSPKTKAIFLAHTLGNPFNINKVLDFCDKNGLWLIEDNCDSLGSRYLYKDEWKYTGTFGHIGASSFYPPHHMTMGEGGAVYTNDLLLKQIVESLRDWGRDCHCPSGQDNMCGKRFIEQYGQLPLGYDHKYVYSHLGYNMRITDMQAAVGLAQLQKLPSFIEKRKSNWMKLRKGLDPSSDFLILPEAEEDSDPSWFGFMITVKENATFNRNQIIDHLESHGIQTRMLFAGNLIKHPCFDELRESNTGYRVVGSLDNTDRVMNDSFWIGVYPGMNDEMIDYMIESVKECVKIK